MSNITIKQLEALNADNHGQTIRESGGLVGRVRHGVRGTTVSFRFEVKLNGVKRDYSLGSWPKKSLASIRDECRRLRVITADGIDPNEAKKAKQIEKQNAIKQTIAQAEQERVNNLTVHNLFHTWLKDGVARQDGNKELNRLFSKDVLPVIGDKPLRELSEKDILTMLRRMLKRGVTRQAVIAHNDTNQMLSWAEKRQPWRRLMADGNPCDLVDIKKLLPSDYTEERDRVLSTEEIRRLDRIIKEQELAYEQAENKRSAQRPINPRAQCAIWICFGTICRIGELLKARWEDVDFDSRIWFIPRENVKGIGSRKQEHYIYLSDFTLKHFKRLHSLTGDTDWCFPSRDAENHVCVKSVSKIIGDRQTQFKNRPSGLKGRRNDNSLVIGNEEWTPHDLRRTGATIMQSLGVSLDVIDRCQNHVLAGSRVRRHYLKYDYAEEKKEAWRLLGDQLEAILSSSATIIDLRSA